MNTVLEELDVTHDYYQYCTLLKQLTSIDPNKITKEKFDNRIRIIKRNPYHKIIVATINGTIVGTATVLIEPKFIHDLSFVAHIEDVVVDSESRNCGVGSVLMRKMIQIAKEFGCYKIILDCSDKNIDYYKKFGFVVKESQMALYLNTSI